MNPSPLSFFQWNGRLPLSDPFSKTLETRLDTIMHSNYRPVSNMPCLSKVVEKVVLDQLGSHCTNYRLIPDYQSAYRANYSCETALLKIVNDILWAMERRDINSAHSH